MTNHDARIPSNPYHLISSNKTWIEGSALHQLQQVSVLKGMEQVIGLPDIHPGKGGPVGATFLTRHWIYPFLVGNDIGCGISMWQTNISRDKVKVDRLVKGLDGLEGPWDGDRDALIAAAQVEPSEFDHSLGTIGGGNHFAELQKIDKIHSPDLFTMLGFDEKRLFLLVHSGSRGLGNNILDSYVRTHNDQPVLAYSEEGTIYLARHDGAIQWAHLNRELIAKRFLDAINADGEKISDTLHNHIQKIIWNEQDYFLHRKGAVSSEHPMVVIPGSRGDRSYLVRPISHAAHHGWSLAHGAGRKWPRGNVQQRLVDKFKPEEMTKTALGGHVICEDRQLLYEEAPQAYKRIDQVIGDLIFHQLVEVIATTIPLITYKIKSRRP